jgi:hypothetical protein
MVQHLPGHFSLLLLTARTQIYIGDLLQYRPDQLQPTHQIL